jgi:hypothetical protein
MYWSNKWWFGNYTTTGTITLLASGLSNGIPALYGFINNTMYQMFGDPTTWAPTQWMTALWSMENPIRDKEVIRAAVELQNVIASGSLIANIDTPTSSTPFVNQGSSALTWQNNAGVTVVWQNNALATVGWVSFGPLGANSLFSGPAASGFSKYVGISGSTTSMNFQLSGIYLSYKWGGTWNSKATS